MIQKIRMDMSIGSNIQKRRYQCKLKQDQVIAKMNLMGIPISKSSYAKIETNRMNIKVSELVALAEILDSAAQKSMRCMTGKKTMRFQRREVTLESVTYIPVKTFVNWSRFPMRKC